MKIHTEVTVAAAHMVHSTRTKCYNLHGHNWRFVISIEGEIQEDGMVVDFNIVKRIVKDLDHKVWFPDPLPDDVKMKAYSDVFDQFKDAIYIPVPVITSEHMAGWVAGRIIDKFDIKRVRVACHEGDKSYAVAERFDYEDK